MTFKTRGLRSLAFASLILAAVHAAGAEDAGLRGTIKDGLGKPVAGVTVQLLDSKGVILGTFTTDAAGSFHLPPTASAPGNTLNVTKSGYQPLVENLTMPLTNQNLELILDSEDELQVQVRVTDKSGAGIAPSGATDYTLTGKDVQDQPNGNNARLAQVLTTAPGVSMDQNQQIHVRQTYVLQYEVNGIALPLDLFGQPGFISLLNPVFIKQADLLTGVLPAQYGFANSGGVLSIQTKDGTEGNGGSLAVEMGQRGTFQPNLQLGGTSGKLSYYVSGLYDTGNTAFSQATPGPNPIHNWTSQGQGFGILSYKFDDTLKLSLISTITTSDNQLPNEGDLTPAYTLSGVGQYSPLNLNNNLNFRDNMEILALNGTPSTDLKWQLSFTNHSLRQDFLPDPIGQLIYSGAAAHSTTGNQDQIVQGQVVDKLTDNTFRAGFTYGRYNMNSASDTLAFPVDSTGAQTSGLPDNILNGFRTADTIQGYYVNDLWHFAPRWDVNLGVRVDAITGFTNACQIDPTINFIFSPNSDTKVHAGYARYMDAPALQAFSPQQQPSFNGTSNAESPGLVNPYVQDDNTWDIGMSHRFGSHFDVTADAYYTINRHFADLGQFGAVPITTGFNYDHGHTSGVETSFRYTNDQPTGRFSANVNLTFGNSYQYGVDSGQYNFGADELAHINALGILLDHQPKIGATSGVSYEMKPWLFSAQLIYSSGLRGGFVDTLQLPSVLQADIGIQRSFGEVTDRLTLINAFDRVNLIRPAGSIGAFETAYGPRFTILDTINVPFHW